MFPDFKKFTLLSQQETIASSKTTAMSEAEKKWRKWDEVNPVFGSLSREAYKAALRREIEKADRNDGIYTHYKKWNSFELLQLLDTVEPTSESKEPKP